MMNSTIENFATESNDIRITKVNADLNRKLLNLDMMKKLILQLLFIPLVFSCSEELDTQPFLEEYNGVVWKDS